MTQPHSFLGKLLLSSVVWKKKKEIISTSRDFCEDKMTVNFKVNEKNSLKSKNFVVWFYFIKIEQKLCRCGKIHLRLPEICLARSSDFYFCWIGLENDGFWKGEIIGRGWKISLEGSWGGEMGKPCWVNDWIGSDFHSYPAVVKAVVACSFFLFQNMLEKYINLSPLGED